MVSRIGVEAFGRNESRYARRHGRVAATVLQAGGEGGARRFAGRVLEASGRRLLLDLSEAPRRDAVEVDLELPAGVFTDPASRRRRLSGRVVHAEAHRVAVELDRPLDPAIGSQRWRLLGWAGAALFFLALGNIVWLKALNLEFFWYGVWANAYSLAVTAYILSRFAIAVFYRPPKAPPDYQPSLSVIIAAKNEAQAIGETIDRVFASDYPREQLEVIAVDDGSTDATFAEMERAQARHPRLRLIRFERNLGKRHAMAAGARAAGGELLVYVDSDSFLESDCLGYLAQGFADPGVTAVAAHGLVANAATNALTRMQAVRYYLAFSVHKAAEGVFASVTCCSGCCSAYRRTAVLAVVEPWLGQTFLGRPATFGDDRSLTNHMLRQGKVLYDDRARVQTIVPDTYGQFFRQQLRWKKSWLRESFIAAGFIWKKPPLMALSFYAGLVLPLLAPFVLLRALVWQPLVLGQPCWYYALGVVLISLLYSAYYLARQRNRMWIYGVWFCLLYMFVLTWQLPWAVLTSWNNKWGTR